MLLQAIPAAAAILFLITGSHSLAALAGLCAFSALCALAYVFGRGGVVSFAGLFVLCFTALYLVYPSTALILDLYVPQDDRVAQYAFLTVGGLSLFLVAHALTSRQRTAHEVPALKPEHVARAFWIFILPLVGALALVAGAWSSLGDLLVATRVVIKEESNALTLMAQYLWIAGSVSVVLGPLYLRGKSLGWIPFLVLVGVAGAAGFLAFRTRSVLVLLVGSLLMGLWLRRQVTSDRGPRGIGADVRRLRTPAAWRLVLLGAVAIVAVSYVRVARGLLEDRGLAGLTQVDIGGALLYNLNRGDLAFTPVVFDVLGYVPEKADYLKGQSYYRLLFTPIPRLVWPGKPPNTQRIVGAWLHPGQEYQTTPPGIQGDLYINFGLVGIVGFLGFGWLFGRLDRWRGLGRLIAVGGGIVPVFHLVRGGFTNPILLLVTLCLAATTAAAIAEGRLRIRSGRRGLLDGLPARDGTG